MRWSGYFIHYPVVEKEAAGYSLTYITLLQDNKDMPESDNRSLESRKET